MKRMGINCWILAVNLPIVGQASSKNQILQKKNEKSWKSLVLNSSSRSQDTPAQKLLPSLSETSEIAAPHAFNNNTLQCDSVHFFEDIKGNIDQLFGSTIRGVRSWPIGTQVARSYRHFGISATSPLHFIRLYSHFATIARLSNGCKIKRCPEWSCWCNRKFTFWQTLSGIKMFPGKHGLWKNRYRPQNTFYELLNIFKFLENSKIGPSPAGVEKSTSLVWFSMRKLR